MKVPPNATALFDLEMEISEIDPGIYTLSFSEPYLGNNEPLEFEADLTKTTDNTYCLSRNEYPWGLPE